MVRNQALSGDCCCNIPIAFFFDRPDHLARLHHREAWLGGMCEAEGKRLRRKVAINSSPGNRHRWAPSPKPRRPFKGKLPTNWLAGARVRFSLWRQTALEFERAVKVQACPAGDLHAIASDCALHVSTAGTELLRTQRVLTQPPRPIWSQRAVYRAGGGVLIDADRRCRNIRHT